jgi:hypothetical protein
MSQEHAEIIRSAFDNFNSRDWESWEAMHHADMVAIPPKEWPEADSVVGLEAWLERVLILLEPRANQRRNPVAGTRRTYTRHSALMALPDSAKELIRSGALGHLVTIGDRGAPQVTCVWVGVEGDELLTAHLNRRLRKLDNVRRDPRVAVSFEGTRIHPPGLREYVVAHGRPVRIEGGPP